MNRPLAVGRNCDAWCTRCKMDLAHTIVAMVGGTPVQVKCNTCDGIHKYRAPKTQTEAPGSLKSRFGGAAGAASTPAAGSAPRSSAPKTTKTAAKAEREAEVSLKELRRRWDEALSRTAGTAQVPYDVKATYAVDDVLEHPKFGLGFVEEEVGFNRIRVLFQDAERVLVARHGQKPE